MHNLTVVNKRTNRFDVYIGRGSPLGNPFPMTNYSSDERERVIEAYKEWFNDKLEAQDPNVLRELSRIKSLLKEQPVSLGCFCAPKNCHGDVIKEHLCREIE